jgi:hypothetical protein
MYPFNFTPKSAFIDFKKLFVAMPFHKDYEPIYIDIIVPSVKKANETLSDSEKLEIYRAKDKIYTRSGWLDILENLYTARVVLGVLSGDNANVFYELGIAHATQQIERQLLIAEKGYKTKFDIKDLIYIEYDLKNISESVRELSGAIKDTLAFYNLNNDRQIQIAKSRLSFYEFEVLMKYGRARNFYLPNEAPQKDYDGLAYLCHSGLLRLATLTKGNGIEFSYWWTDLGNAILTQLEIIDEKERLQRLS